MSQMTMKPMHRGVDAILSINDIILGGQQNATLNRSMSPINITNKINGEWEDNMSGLRHWTLSCTGLFVKNSEAFALLEDAFNQGKKVTIKLSDNEKTYEGEALITNFPVAVNYNANFTYNITLLGTGELK